MKECLLACDFQASHLDASTIRVDAPAVALYAIYTVGVAAYIVDVHGTNAVVGSDNDVIGVVGRTLEHVAIAIGKEAYTCCALLLKVYLASFFALIVNDKRVEHVGISATNKRDTKLVALASCLNSELDTVLIAQTWEQSPGIASKLKV